MKVTGMRNAIRTSIMAMVIGAAGMLAAPHIMAHDGATGIIKERMDKFKASQGHLKAISKLMGGDAFGEIAERAVAMRDWGVAMPNAFPEGSDKAPSDALPAIWSDNAGFKDAANNHVIALDALINAAEGKDMGAVTIAFRDVAGTCKACHMKYRKF